MLPIRIVISLAVLVKHLNANPVDIKHEARQNQWVPPFEYCNTCFLSSWTQGPECTTDPTLQSTINRVLHPPSDATSTYTPTKWCTDFLRRTSWSTQYITTSEVSTYTDFSVTHLFATTTDYDHPTSTVYCPIPSSGMECGWDSNTIAPLAQGEDWTIEHAYNSTECQQVCLDHPNCKAYRLANGLDDCEIFNVALGKNASNVVNPTPHGSQWWDRDCQQHAPTPCKSGGTPVATVALTTATISQTPVYVGASPSQPLMTSAPTPVPRAEPVNIAKRDAPLPPYMNDLEYYWSSIYLAPACSCLVTSALPGTSSVTTFTRTDWTSHTTVSSTIEDWLWVTLTPRSTTIYTSIN